MRRVHEPSASNAAPTKSGGRERVHRPPDHLLGIYGAEPPDRWHTVPTVDSEEFRNTWLYQAFPCLVQRFPARAYNFAHFYDRKLIPSITFSNDLIERLTREHLAHNERKRAENAATEECIDAVSTEFAAYRSESEEKRLGIEERLTEAEREANVALKGHGVFDPSNVADSTLSRFRSSLRSFFGDGRIPMADDDSGVGPANWIVLGAGCLIGIAMGLSYASVGGAIRLDALSSTSLVLLLFIALLGISVSLVSAYATQIAARCASQMFSLGRGLLSKAAASILAATTFLLLAAIHGAVDANGMLKVKAANAAIDSLGKAQSAQHLTLDFIGMCLMLGVPYLILHVLLGVMSGRVSANNRIQAIAERASQTEEVTHFANPGVQTAREKLGAIRICQAELKRHDEACAKGIGRFETRIERLRAKIHEISDDLPPRSQQQIQRSIDQVLANQAQADALWLELSRDLEGQTAPSSLQGGV